MAMFIVDVLLTFPYEESQRERDEVTTPRLNNQVHIYVILLEDIHVYIFCVEYSEIHVFIRVTNIL